jgi:hypothetical protein
MVFTDSLVSEAFSETALGKNGPWGAADFSQSYLNGFQVSDFWCEAIGSEYAVEGMRHFSILIKMADNAVSGGAET